MATRKRTTPAEVNATIEGGDVQGIVGARQVFVENQIFFGSGPVAEGGENAQSGSGQHVGTFPVWHVPYPRNPHFTGRVEVIARIQEDLLSGQVAAVTQAIAGLGGIGKTQLALEYCYRQASSYKVVWWIRAESKETRTTDLAALAKRLQLGSTDESNLSDSARAVVEWLNRTSGWLLIFDNVEHPEDLEDLLPAAGRGHILITSRHASWGAWAKTISLNVWTSQESTQYLLKRTSERHTEANEQAAAALAAALGHLPLAIEQAAAYIEESKIGISSYAELFAQHEIRLFEGRAAQQPSAQRTIATVWDISLRAVERASPGAVALLQLCAFMGPDRISKQEIESRHNILPGPLKTIASNKIALHDAIATLRRYSLVDATPQYISVHRLVQLVVRDRLHPSDYRRFHEVADRLEHGLFDSSLNAEPEGSEKKPTDRWKRADDTLWRRSWAIVISAVLGTIIWELAVRIEGIPPYVLPAPSAVVKTLVADRSLLWDALSVTLLTTLQGLGLAVISGVGLAILLNAIPFKRSHASEYTFYPYALPIGVAITPFLLIYLPQETAVLVLAWVAAFFPVFANTTLGLNSVDLNVAGSSVSDGASRLGLLRVKLSSALPYMFRGLKIGGGLSLVGTCVAEALAASAGAGSGLVYRLIESGYRLNIPRMFAALILLSAAGLVIFLTLSLLSYLLLYRWHESTLVREP